MLGKLKKKLLSVKLKNEKGKEIFRRYSLIETPYFNIFIHKISGNDNRHSAHSHPWNFYSFILKGKYKEALNFSKPKWYGPSIKPIKRSCKDFHKIVDLDGPVWTLVFTGKEEKDWIFIESPSNKSED